MSRSAAAKGFGVSIASAVCWVARFKAKGEISPAPTGGDRRYGRIEAHRDYLLGLIRRQPDMPLLEIQERLIAKPAGMQAAEEPWRAGVASAAGFTQNAGRWIGARRAMECRMSKIQPVVMCGGSGTRVWPESRESLPKQFIPLIGDRSTFQSVVGLLGDRSIFEPPVVITNFDYRFRVAEQLKEIGAEATILLEPERRDSAAAVGAAAAWAAGRDPATVVAVLAADHVFEEEAKFAGLCARAGAAAEAGEIVTFGVTPDHPATGYGYIHPGEALAVDPAGAAGRALRREAGRGQGEDLHCSRAICGTRAISCSAPT